MLVKTEKMLVFGVSLPAGFGGFYGNTLTAGCGQLSGSSFAALLSAHTTKGYRVRIALILRRNGKGLAVHLFADGMLYNFAGNLHEVALRGWAFRHVSIMPWNRGRQEALWKSY
jgi:hypothetical protein